MKINLTAPANPLGYGVVGMNVLKSLCEQGHEVSYFPIGSPEVEPQDAQLFQECLNRQDAFDKSAPSLRVWHQHDLAQHVGKKLHVGFPIFELDTFTKREVHQLSSQDVILVCSQWAKDVVDTALKDNHSGRAIHVAPLGVDRTVFYDAPSTDPATVFLNIGKWEVRKGHDILIEAFNNAFTREDNVKLLMMNHNPFISPADDREWKRLYKSGQMGDQVEFLNRVKSHTEVADIIRAADCGVFPSRAEGWNLEALEMMSCGKHVIATDYSAHTEFCNEDNCHLIQVNELEEAYDGIWFKGQGRWAKIGKDQMEQTVEYFRFVHRQKQESGDINNTMGIETAKKFSWNNTADSIIRSIT